MRITIDPEDWVTVSEGARLAGVTKSTFSDAIDRRRMEVLEICGIRFVKRDDAVSFRPRKYESKQKEGEA
jgi:hypothetical protein